MFRHWSSALCFSGFSKNCSPVPKYIGVDTYHKLYFVICNLFFYLVHLLVNILNYYDIEQNEPFNICVKCHLCEEAMLKDI
jgi:hypothetical protein